MTFSKLKNHTDDILKAEIGALLFNLGKTHIGFWREKNGVVYFNVDNNKFKSEFGYKPFSGYKSYYKKHSDINKTPFEFELEKTSKKLKDFIFNEKVKFSFEIEPKNKGKKECRWSSFFKGNALTESEDCYNFIQKIFFRGCENINSGIDKGSPQDSNQLKQLRISNAFGGITKKVTDEKDFDAHRVCFLRDLHRFLEDNHYYNSPDWAEIRNFVLNRIKLWYSRLLSDSRFPVNDVTLWNHAYMTASMFKAALASLYLDNSKQQDFIDNPQSIKWSILGVQYDKLGLAEKGLKAASVKWYRDTSEKVDNEVKKIIEISYAVGNEIYRDETGIYFIVGENLKGDNKEGDFYKLNEDLSELKDKIIDIFSKNFEGEIYPAILLTEPSRGLMNLGHLIEESEENFLKTEMGDLPNMELKKITFNNEDYFVHPVKNFVNKANEEKKEPNTAVGVCPICKTRLVFKSDLKNDPPICNTCAQRQNGRIDKWRNNLKGETIWIDELQDKNGRIALVTLKFELDEWINGDLVNSLLVQQNDAFEIPRKRIKNFFLLFLSNIPVDFNTEVIDKEINEIEELLKKSTNPNEKKNIGQKKGKLLNLKRKITEIKGIIEGIKISKWWNEDLNKDIGIASYTGKNVEGLFDILAKKYRNIKSEIKIDFLEELSFFPLELSADAYKGCKTNKESFNDYIKQVFFGSIVGNEWGKLVRNSSLNNKINWKEETIDWPNLDNNDIEFLSQLLLQFLIRKNPSPARLRRIWETTREFFEELKENIISLAGIPEERQKRLVWNNVKVNGNFIPDGEYRDGDIEFWARKGTVYLIASIEKITLIKKNTDKNTFNLQKRNGSGAIVTALQKAQGQKQGYEPYFTILSPTPVSWQFIIPAEYASNLIKSVQEEYYKNFKWVYGKLPLHIGVVVQNYKKPLYVSIKALRKIRRDRVGWKNLRRKISAKDLKSRQKTAFYYEQIPEQNADCENFYSLFERADNTGKGYNFYLYPESSGRFWIDTTQNSLETDEFYIYPNTFDFEFLDTNTRRNDIYYGDKAKRVIKYKVCRPYDAEDWQYFDKFNEYFNEDKNSFSRMQKLVSLIHSKLEDWGDNNLDSLKQFMTSAFINVLDLKDNKSKDKFASILGYESYEQLEGSNTNEFKDKLLMFIDMFEFWHTMLKKI